ncbi:hypothetical protein DE146DRAFT_646667, partial [Phaeosphaeria sp. MPI-PUGE-AT-0046c]
MPPWIQPPRRMKSCLSSKSEPQDTAQCPVLSVPKRHKTGRIGSELCSRCKEIDFQAIFKQEGLISTPQGRFVACLDNMLCQSTLPACRLFDQIAVPHLGPKITGHHLRADSAASIFRSTGVMTQARSAVALAVLPGCFKGKLAKTAHVGYVDRGVALPNVDSHATLDSTEIETGIAVAIVRASEVNYDRCNAWITCCSTLHGKNCAAAKDFRRSTVPLKCIDYSTSEIGSISNDD